MHCYKFIPLFFEHDQWNEKKGRTMAICVEGERDYDMHTGQLVVVNNSGSFSSSLKNEHCCIFFSL